MKTILSVGLIVLINYLLVKQFISPDNDYLSFAFQKAQCQPYGAHIELGTSFQLNNYVNKDAQKYNSSNEFVISYQTKGNTCTFGKDVDIQLEPSIQLLRVSNYTSAPDNSTINCAKYGLSENKQITYSFSPLPLTKHSIILPELYEDKNKTYSICLFNQVENFQNTTCNLAQLFHYKVEQPYKFFTTEKHYDFISSHVFHLVSTFSTQDADLAPFGSKHYFFNFNFMFMMTLDVTEEENISKMLSIFQKNVPTALQNRNERPWFVGIANKSPYILSKGGIQLDNKYSEIYQNLNKTQFNIIFTSSPKSKSLNIYQGSTNNTTFKKISSGQTQLNSNQGLIIVEIPTFSKSPILFETSYRDFKIIENGQTRLTVERSEMKTSYY